jgi:hypothetical protein
MHPVHLPKVGIAPCGDDRWPCATGLVSYPFKLRFVLMRMTSFSKPSTVRILLLASEVIAVFSDAFLADRSIRGDLIPFHLPVATPERFGGRFGSSKTAGSSTSTLAHSNNSSVLYRLCAPQIPKPRNTGA